MVDKRLMNETNAAVNGIVHREGRLMISGDLNFFTVAELWKASYPWLSTLEEYHFDLGGVTFSNSAGLALLIEWIKYAEKTGKNISFHHIPSQLHTMIKTAGLNFSHLAQQK